PDAFGGVGSMSPNSRGQPLRTATAVSLRDRYLFDLRGYVVVPGVLGREEVARYNAHLDRVRPEQMADANERDEALKWLFDLDGEFAALMDHERVLPYLRAFVDDKVRIDGAYALVKLA